MRIPGWVFLIGAFVAVLLTVGLSVLAYSMAQEVAIDLSDAGVEVQTAGDFFASLPTATSTPTPLPTGTPLPTETLRPGETPLPTATASLTPTLDPAAAYTWNDPRRITILLMGIDQRSGISEDGPFRTDTMMLVQIDPVRQTAGVISIPRDLWVEIPGAGMSRINTANSVGESKQLPGGGPVLAMDTVTANLGIDVDNFILVNFDVFLAIVDMVAQDGVEICVEEVIDDPDYPDAGYGTIAVYFEPGCQDLDAERLLQYARTRATDGADFDRARRQQQVMRAMQAELISAGGVTSFVSQAPALWDELSGSFQTDLSLNEIVSLAFLVQDIPRENIQFGVIDNLYVNFATTDSGDRVLVPRFSAISFLLQQTFSAQEYTLADLAQRSQQEGASIVVYNNTDTAGLAAQTRDWLISQGVTVQSVGNIPEPTNTDTRITDYRAKLWTAKYLAELMGMPPDVIQSGGDGLTSADIMIVVGPDIQSLLSASPADGAVDNNEVDSSEG